MTDRISLQLLVSVRDEAEARDALWGGADWIDLKEPHAGALGAVSVSTARSVVRAIAGRCPLSAALGELVDWSHSPAREMLGVDGISVVKLGLKNCAQNRDWSELWAAAYHECLNAGVDLAAVIYSDWQRVSAPPPDEVLKLATEVGTRYLLIDTFSKNSESSLELLTLKELARLMYAARCHGIVTVLAGNLRSADFLPIAGLPVQMVAVRGAACTAERTSRIDRRQVSKLRQHLSEAQCRAKDWTATLTTLI